jgi:hypothetical protein
MCSNLSSAIQENPDPTTRLSGEMSVGPSLLYVSNYNNGSHISVDGIICSPPPRERLCDLRSPLANVHQEQIESWPSPSTKQVALAVTLSSCIREVLGSNLGRDISYPDWGFSCFSSVPPGKCQDSIAITPRAFPSKSFSINRSFCHPIIRRYTECSRRKGQYSERS